MKMNISNPIDDLWNDVTVYSMNFLLTDGRKVNRIIVFPSGVEESYLENYAVEHLPNVSRIVSFTELVQGWGPKKNLEPTLAN